MGVFLLLSLEMYQKLAKIRLEIVHNIRFELDEIDDKWSLRFQLLHIILSLCGKKLLNICKYIENR